MAEGRVSTEDTLSPSRLLDGLVDAVIALSPTGEVRYWNRGAERMYGYQRSEAVGRTLDDLVVPPERRAEEDARRREALETGSAWFDTARQRKDGSRLYVSVSLQTVDGAVGCGGGLVASERDTTRLKHLREAELLEAKFRGLLEAAPDALLVVNEDGCILLVNGRLEAMFGYRRDELLAAPVELLVPDRLRGVHVERRREFAANPRAREMGVGLELYGLRKDGTEFPVEISLSPLELDGQRLTMAAIRDTTDRRKAEARFRALLEAAPDAFVIVDQDGLITLVNAQAEALFGYRRDQLLGRPVEVLMPERFRAGHVRERRAFVASPRARPMGVDLELYGLRQDGTEIPVEISLNPLATEQGTLTIAAIRDVREKRAAAERERLLVEERMARARAEAEVQARNEFLEHVRRLNAQLEQRVQERTAALEAVNRELEAFGYSISHDLRAPLRAMDGYSRILLEDFAGELSEAGQRYLRSIRQNAQRMGGLIDSLLAFSRVSRQELRRQPVDPGHLAREALDDLQSELAGRRVEATVADLPPCQADPTLLRQVFANLLGNAVKFTRDRETAVIEVGYAMVQGQPAYYVKDNGVGFDMQYADKLFRVFERLHHADEFEGTGIGLAFVQRIVQRHGGRVWAEGAPGQGATFFFTIGGAAEDGQR